MCYRRSGTDIPLGERELSAILENINTKCILMGDFNTNMLNVSENHLIRNFCNSIKEYSFLPMIDKPTRVHNFTATLLDQIYINFDKFEKLQ